jgi:predicted translin family RNA/ssDNA-binding protein
MVSRYQVENHVVEYIVSTANRYWVITIQCAASSKDRTKATVSYTYTGLTDLGNEINRQAIKKMFERDLEDWEEAINHYLESGEVLKHP